MVLAEEAGNGTIKELCEPNKKIGGLSRKDDGERNERRAFQAMDNSYCQKARWVMK